jgi:hypothetical protein
VNGLALSKLAAGGPSDDTRYKQGKTCKVDRNKLQQFSQESSLLTVHISNSLTLLNHIKRLNTLDLSSSQYTSCKSIFFFFSSSLEPCACSSLSSISKMKRAPEWTIAEGK